MNKDWAKEAAAEIGERCIRFKYPKRSVKYFIGKRVIVYKEGSAEEIILAHAAPILAENEGLKKEIEELKKKLVAEEKEEKEDIEFGGY